MPCALGVALLVAQAVTVAGSATSPRTDVDRFTRRYRAAVVRRDVGWALSGLGLAALIAGGLTVAHGATAIDPSTTEGYAAVATHVVAGSGTILLSLGLGVPGIVLAIQGQNEMTEMVWRIRSALPTVAVLPLRGGAGLSMRFRF